MADANHLLPTRCVCVPTKNRCRVCAFRPKSDEVQPDGPACFQPTSSSPVVDKVPATGDEAWLESPKGPDGDTLQVGFRIGWERISDVSTLQSTVWINIAITFYWTDPRLAGWKGDLPPLLWLNDLQYLQFCSQDLHFWLGVHFLQSLLGVLNQHYCCPDLILACQQSLHDQYY